MTIPIPRQQPYAAYKRISISGIVFAHSPEDARIAAEFSALDTWDIQRTHVLEVQPLAVPDVLPGDPCIQVEYDLSYEGGNYTLAGDFAYIPLPLIEAFGKKGDVTDVGVWYAFTYWTGHDHRHIVSWESSELYAQDGEEYEGDEEDDE